MNLPKNGGDGGEDGVGVSPPVSPPNNDDFELENEIGGDGGDGLDKTILFLNEVVVCLIIVIATTLLLLLHSYL